MKKMVCLITSIDFLSIQPLMRPLFSGQQELSNLDYFFQNGGKTGAQTNQSFWKLNNIFWWSKISHIIIKGLNFIIKSFSGQVVFCFAILRAICMSYRVPPLTYRRTPSSYKDRKGSFTTRPTGKVPGYNNVIKKGLLFTATSMLAQYQQGGHGLFRWWGKPESLEKNHRKLVRNRQTV